MKILLKNVKLLGKKDLTDIALAKGKIQDIGKVRSFSSGKIIDARGLNAIPGLIDLAGRLREPGPSKRGTIASETKAAAASGVTTICLPPDTEPVIDNPAVVELIQQRQEKAGFAKILPLAAMTKGLKGKQLGAVGTLQEEGCVGVSNALCEFASTKVLFRAMQYAKSFDLTVHLHPFNHALAGEGTAHQGEVADYLGLPGISQAAETTALAQILMLVEETEARVHICRVSSARSVELIREAKNRGLAVTADVALHQLFYNEENLYGFDSCFRVLPPFRSKADQKGLRAAVLDGTIDAICSDHQPQNMDDKLLPFSASSIGISSYDSFMADLLKFAGEEKLRLNRLLDLVNKNPAKILGQNENKLKPGNVADFSLLDLDKVWSLNEKNILSKGKNNPRIGQALTGQVMYTFVDGKQVFSRN